MRAISNRVRGNGLPPNFHIAFRCTFSRSFPDIPFRQVRVAGFIGRGRQLLLFTPASPVTSLPVGIAVKKSQRSLIVFTGILGVLTVTSALLLALAPAPLAQAPVNSLFAVDSPKTLDAIFDTATRVRPGRWKYIYIHHSQTIGGDALSIANGEIGDHFVIGNGDGTVEGEIEIGSRWNQQNSALPPRGAKVDPMCISICVVGDFDRTVPTPTQLRRLAQLVGALQGQLHISRENVILVDQPHTPGGTGKYFPAAALRSQLLP